MRHTLFRIHYFGNTLNVFLRDVRTDGTYVHQSRPGTDNLICLLKFNGCWTWEQWKFSVSTPENLHCKGSIWTRYLHICHANDFTITLYVFNSSVLTTRNQYMPVIQHKCTNRHTNFPYASQSNILVSLSSSQFAVHRIICDRISVLIHSMH